MCRKRFSLLGLPVTMAVAVAVAIGGIGTGCGQQAQAPPDVIVVVQARNGIAQDMARAVEATIVHDHPRVGEWRLGSAREINPNMAPVHDVASAIRLGQTLGVRLVLLGSLSDEPTTTVRFALADVESGRVVRAKSQQLQRGVWVAQAAARVALDVLRPDVPLRDPRPLPRPRPEPVPVREIEPGTITGELTPADFDAEGKAVHEYTFVGALGDTIALAFSSGEFDCLLVLTRPDGTVEISDDVSPIDTNSQIDMQLNQTGTYRVRCTTFNIGETGRYTLIFSREIADPTATPRWVENVPNTPGQAIYGVGRARFRSLSMLNSALSNAAMDARINVNNRINIDDALAAIAHRYAELMSESKGERVNMNAWAAAVKNEVQQYCLHNGRVVRQHVESSTGPDGTRAVFSLVVVSFDGLFSAADRIAAKYIPDLRAERDDELALLREWCADWQRERFGLVPLPAPLPVAHPDFPEWLLAPRHEPGVALYGIGIGGFHAAPMMARANAEASMFARRDLLQQVAGYLHPVVVEVSPDGDVAGVMQVVTGSLQGVDVVEQFVSNPDESGYRIIIVLARLSAEDAYFSLRETLMEADIVDPDNAEAWRRIRELMQLEPPTPRARPLAPNSIVERQFRASDVPPDGRAMHVYTFEGRAGDEIVLRYQSEHFDCVLFLEAPDGTTVENDDEEPGVTNSRLEQRLEQTGTYRVRCTTYNPGEIGPYRLEFALTGDDD